MGAWTLKAMKDDIHKGNVRGRFDHYFFHQSDSAEEASKAIRDFSCKAIANKLQLS